jgi:hypothetical protein
MDDEIYDFGLDPGESFEPEDADDEEPFDLSQPHLLTMLGPIDPDELGFAVTVREVMRERWRADPGAAIADLENAHFAGLRAVVVPVRDAADTDDLVWIAQRSPVHLAPFAPGDIDAAGWQLIDESAFAGEMEQTLLVVAAETVLDAVERTPLVLMERGLTAAEVRILFLDNPARALTSLTRIGEG